MSSGASGVASAIAMLCLMSRGAFAAILLPWFLIGGLSKMGALPIRSRQSTLQGANTASTGVPPRRFTVFENVLQAIASTTPRMCCSAYPQSFFQLNSDNPPPIFRTIRSK
jgi:hypothetical protein